MEQQDLTGDLAQMQKAWKEGKDTPPGPPNGVYELQVQSASLKKAATSGKLMTFWEFMVLGGEYEGNVFRDVISLAMESGPYRVGQRIRRLGLDAPDDIGELPALFDLIAATNPIVRGRVQHSGDFINVNVQELLAEAPVITATGESIPEDPTSPFQPGVTVTIDVKGKKVPCVIRSVDRKAGSATLEDDVNVYEEVLLEDITVTTEADPMDGGAKGSPGTEPIPKEEPDDRRQELLEFCLSQNLQEADPEVSEKASATELLAVIDQYPWEVGELTPAEATLLKDKGIKVAPKKPAKKKK